MDTIGEKPSAGSGLDLQPRAQTYGQAFTFCVFLCAAMLTPFVIIALGVAPPGISPAWDWANGVGYLALAIYLLLFVYRGRAHRFPAYSGRFFANLHRDLGYIAMLLLAAHVGTLLLIEPLLLEHLKPTAPLHMLAGLLALILMLLLVCFSVPTLRRQLWPDYHLFRKMHAVVAVAIVALTAFHVYGSGFYLNSTWKLGFAAGAAGLVLINYTLHMYRLVRPAAGRTRNSGRYSHVISYGTALLAVLLCLALAWGNNVE